MKMNIGALFNRTAVWSIVLSGVGLLAHPSLAACPSSGLTAASGTTTINANCAIVGDLVLSGSAAVKLTAGKLTISGNIVLRDDAKVEVANATLAFKQTSYYQYYIELYNRTKISFTNAKLSTNETGKNNLSMSLTAYDNSSVDVSGSNLDANTTSWLLAHFYNNSKLNVVGTKFLPTEIYPSDSSTTTVSTSDFATLWLDLAKGDTGVVTVPSLDNYGKFNLAFSPSAGSAYTIDAESCNFRIGLNSHPGSSLTVNGSGASTMRTANVVIGYYIEDATGPVTIDGLSVATNITKTFTDQGRTLALKNVYLNPFSWQVYAERTNGYTVTIQNSKINELATFSNAIVKISNSTLQLAVTAVGGPGARLDIINSDIWSQAVQAMSGGKLYISNSKVHGNIISSSGGGAAVSMTNVTEYRNGKYPQSCARVNGYPPHNVGVPLCNPYNPLYQCSQLKASGGATITSSPKLTCPAL
jgi:hypothetical protein